MAGGGTSSPMLDFKSLYPLLSGKYKVVVIEKAGYGFSDVVDGKRNLATILSETREALWKSSQRAYFAEYEGCQIIDLPCSHYVHDLEYEKIARDMEIFLDRLN
ncbi:MAG TPA: hypothetical protein GXZ55_03255 [Natronincola sp.]|nr:hypothetical protein [Natronincola sp.]